MKILIIGSEGFIGGYLTRALLDQGHAVTGYDCGRADETRHGYSVIDGDLTDAAALTQAAAGMDMVINLAAQHQDFGVSRAEFFRINEAGTRVILEVLTKLEIKKFVFYSSVAVYGDVDGTASEDSPLTPSNDYGESKLAAERLIQPWAAADPARQVLVVRPTVVFGPHNYANMYRLIDNIARHRFLLVGKGENIKSVSYVENLVAGTVFLMDRLAPGYAAYNYVDYPHHTARQLVDVITDALGYRRLNWHLPLKPVLFVAGAIDWLAKVTKINFPITANRIYKLNKPTCYSADRIRALGYEQSVSIDEGLRRMVAWYKK